MKFKKLVLGCALAVAMTGCATMQPLTVKTTTGQVFKTCPVGWHQNGGKCMKMSPAGTAGIIALEVLGIMVLLAGA